MAAALLLRCQGLLDDGGGAGLRFEESLAVDCCGPYDQARTRLVFGEWLRRHRRPSAAKEQLVAAYETFDRIGAQGWLPRPPAPLLYEAADEAGYDPDRTSFIRGLRVVRRQVTDQAAIPP